MIDVRLDDLAFCDADAIARPVDAELQATTPLLRRLDHAAGPALARQLHAHEPLAVGSAVVTGAGDLGAELLIHAVIMSMEERVSREGVRRALTSVLQRAADWDVRHLALPPLGVGAGQLELEESAAVTAEVLARHRAGGRGPARVSVIVETELEREIFAGFVARDVQRAVAP
jgi:O-acetyl-ADP-ribose deacetylase (regulator of RNase III)